MPLIKKVIIYRNDNVELLYRWRILGDFIKIHKFVNSDTDCMHDHPWNFITFIFKGQYWEETPNGIIKNYKAPCILYRPATHIHRISIDKPVWTLVINFGKLRSWGFHTIKGWVHWKEYRSNGSCDN
jgi:hypothetical protein